MNISRLLLLVMATGVAYSSCQRPSVSTEELYDLDEGELLSAKRQAVGGDVSAAERVSDYYTSRRDALSDGLEWTIIAARLGSKRARNFLKFASRGGALQELVEIIEEESQAENPTPERDPPESGSR